MRGLKSPFCVLAPFWNARTQRAKRDRFTVLRSGGVYTRTQNATVEGSE